MNIVIAGQAKSGTTGLYQTVKKAMLSSGIEFLCLFEPKGPKPWESYFSKCKKDSSILTKIMLKKRFFESDAINAFDKRIMITRDPRDRLLSAFLFKPLSRPKKLKSHVPRFVKLLKEKENDPASISFLELVEKADQIGFGSLNYKMVSEMLLYQNYAISTNNFFSLKYEAFVSNEFDSLSKYLGMPVAGNEPQPDWLKHIERSRGYGEWRNWFTPRDVEILRPLLQTAMGKIGYNDDWELPETQVIEPSTSSEYVISNFDRRYYQETIASKENNFFTGRETSREIFELSLQRARDGRPDDVLRVARVYEKGSKSQEKDIDKAVYWYNIGRLFRLKSCNKALKRLSY